MLGSNCGAEDLTLLVQDVEDIVEEYLNRPLPPTSPVGTEGIAAEITVRSYPPTADSTQKSLQQPKSKTLGSKSAVTKATACLS